MRLPSKIYRSMSERATKTTMKYNTTNGKSYLKIIASLGDIKANVCEA